MAGEGDGSGVGNESRRDSSPDGPPNASSKLDDGLDLRVIESVRAGVGVDTVKVLAAKNRLMSVAQLTPWR